MLPLATSDLPQIEILFFYPRIEKLFSVYNDRPKT